MASRSISAIMWTLLSINVITLVIGGLVAWLGYAIPARLKQFGLLPEIVIGAGFAALLVACLGLCALNYSSARTLYVYGLSCAVFLLILVVGLPDHFYKSDQFSDSSLPKDIVYFTLLSILIILLLFSLTLARHLHHRPDEADGLSNTNNLSGAHYQPVSPQKDSTICTCPHRTGFGSVAQELRTMSAMENKCPNQSDLSIQHLIHNRHQTRGALCGSSVQRPQETALALICPARPNQQQNLIQTNFGSDKSAAKDCPDLIHKAFFERPPANTGRPYKVDQRPWSNVKLQDPRMEPRNLSYDVTKRSTSNQILANVCDPNAISSASDRFNRVKPTYYKSTYAIRKPTEFRNKGTASVMAMTAAAAAALFGSATDFNSTETSDTTHNIPQLSMDGQAGDCQCEFDNGDNLFETPLFDSTKYNTFNGNSRQPLLDFGSLMHTDIV